MSTEQDRYVASGAEVDLACIDGAHHRCPGNCSCSCHEAERRDRIVQLCNECHEPLRECHIQNWCTKPIRAEVERLRAQVAELERARDKWYERNVIERNALQGRIERAERVIVAVEIVKRCRACKEGIPFEDHACILDLIAAYDAGRPSGSDD